MLEMHKKSDRIHYHSPVSHYLTFCGLDRSARQYKTTQDIGKVNCGNCLVVYHTASTAPEPTNTPVGVRALMVDSAPDPNGKCTVWEVNGRYAWALGHAGQRLHQEPVSFEAVEQDFGPLRGISEVELVRSHLLDLESFVLNN